MLATVDVVATGTCMPLWTALGRIQLLIAMIRSIGNLAAGLSGPQRPELKVSSRQFAIRPMRDCIIAAGSGW